MIGIAQAKSAAESEASFDDVGAVHPSNTTAMTTASNMGGGSLPLTPRNHRSFRLWKRFFCSFNHLYCGPHSIFIHTTHSLQMNASLTPRGKDHSIQFKFG